jgi:hypothetical protein
MKKMIMHNFIPSVLEPSFRLFILSLPVYWLHLHPVYTYRFLILFMSEARLSLISALIRINSQYSEADEC